MAGTTVCWAWFLGRSATTHSRSVLELPLSPVLLGIRWVARSVVLVSSGYVGAFFEMHLGFTVRFTFPSMNTPSTVFNWMRECAADPPITVRFVPTNKDTTLSSIVDVETK